ncbi:MAG: ribosome maturation protein RimP [Sphingorhabdus sp.]
MPDLGALSAIIAPEVEALGFDLVRVAWLARGGMEGSDPALQVMAERPDTRQLNIDDCAAISRRLSEKFDELDPVEEAYRLEVSSPGIDRPLTRLSDFADWQGHEARIVLIEMVDRHKKLRGDLAGVEGETILLDDRKFGRKQFEFANVDNAKLLLTDRLIASSAPVNRDGVDDIETEDELDA